MIPEHPYDKDCEYLADGSCYRCCDACNYNRHLCHFCGTELDHNSYETVPVTTDGGRTGGWGKKRHWLSDCRPDLVEHEEGPTCTWWTMTRPEFLQKLRDDGKEHLAERYEGQPICYAYRDRDSGEFGTEHKHFYPDSPTV